MSWVRQAHPTRSDGLKFAVEDQENGPEVDSFYRSVYEKKFGFPNFN